MGGGGGEGGGGREGAPRATSTFYSVKLCIIIFINVIEAIMRYQAFRESQLL